MLNPDWPAPAKVFAAVTTREGGVSEGPYASFNTATHVGDKPEHVAENRRLLQARWQLPGSPCWLNQVHGTQVATLNAPLSRVVEADAAVTTQPDVICAIQTADCLPVFFCDVDGTRVAAAHAGWAGLQAGVLESTLVHFPDPALVMAWLGPAISQQHFEVGPEVKAGFMAAAPVEQRDSIAKAFIPSARQQHWYADLYQLATLRLVSLGVKVFGGGLCTFDDQERFFSYRRDQVTGRMASLIYIKS